MQRDHAVGMRGQRGIVRHQHQRCALAAIEFEEQFQHLLTGPAIQVARRLVRQQNRRFRDERASQRHTLLLATGQLNRVMIHTVGQTHADQQFLRPLRDARPRPGKFRRKQHVLFGGQSRDELERLEHEPDFPATHFGHPVFRKPGDVDTVQPHLAGRRVIQTSQQPEQRTLAAPRGPHNGGELALRNTQIDTSQDLHPVRGCFDGSGQADDFNNWARDEYSPLFQTSVMIMAVSSRLMLFIPLAVSLISCGKPVEAPEPVAAVVKPSPVVADSRPVIACFGDSLSAGYGVEPGKSFPDILQQLMDTKGYEYRVANFGMSGDTTTDGLERLPTVLAAKPAIVVLEFGGNDGLRGLPVTSTAQNLSRIVETLNKAGIKVVLAGMTLPRNYGPEYIHSFEKVYTDVASRYRLVRIPFLLDGVGGNTALTQPDGIHPTAEGARIVAGTVMRYLEPVLR